MFIRIAFLVLLGLSLTACAGQLDESSWCATTEFKLDGKSPAEAFSDDEDRRLLQSALCGLEEEAKAAIEAGGNVNARSDTGVTLLIWAVTANNHEAARMLLSLGSDPDQNNYYDTNRFDGVQRRAVSYATIHSDNAMLKMLIDAGANVDYRKTNQTPLMYAAVHGDVETVRLLLDAGANPNVADKHGLSAAGTQAIAAANFDSLSLLLSHGYCIELERAKSFLEHDLTINRAESYKKRARKALEEVNAYIEKGVSCDIIPLEEPDPSNEE